MPPRLNPDYFYYKLKIVKSPIHRWGVVAEQTIPKNECVIEYTGQLLSRATHKKVTSGRRHVFTYELDKYWSLDGAVRGSGAERINHSCNPNTYAHITGHRIFFYSLRRIKKGEELTVDYQFGSDPNPTPCNCGSKKCRGTINIPSEK